MPTYVYQIVNDDGSDGEVVEVFQKMTDAPLTVDPTSGRAMRRMVTAPHISGNWSDSSSKQKLSNNNLDRMGFTKYERAGDGHYEKKAGKGPDVISAD